MKPRAWVMPLVAAFLGFSAFLRTPGADNVRAVQMVTLIATGIGLGVALAHVRIALSAREKD
jgi:hypothetical protein